MRPTMGVAPRRNRTASLHDGAYAAFVNELARLRKDAKLTQRLVADGLGWNQSQISKIETRQRRIDVVEFIRVAEVVGFDAVALVRSFQRRLRDKEIQ